MEDLPAAKRIRSEAVSLGTSATLDDVHIQGLGPLPPPGCVIEEHPLTDRIAAQISKTRRVIGNIVQGNADKEGYRLVVVVGPKSVCSIEEAKQYTDLVSKAAQDHVHDLVVVMRVVFESSGTSIGWTELLGPSSSADESAANSNSPRSSISKGLYAARQLLLDIGSLGLPCATEFSDTISPQFYADLIAWGGIGARTAESQMHRELASGLSMPVGICNGTKGSIQIAVDAVKASSQPHCFIGVTKEGVSAIVHTNGNTGAHVVLSGHATGSNHGVEDVASVRRAMETIGVHPSVMIDCCQGQFADADVLAAQEAVVMDVALQISKGNMGICGVLLNTPLQTDKEAVVTSTTALLASLAHAVQMRRELHMKQHK